MDLLSGSDSDTTEKKDSGFKINKAYAKSYERFRKREEKQRLIDKYGNPDASESEEEEIRSTQALDKEWLRAFAVVRFKQPRLYSGEKLFNEEVKPMPKKSEEKKFTLKDQERKFFLEKGGVVSDDENEDMKRRKAEPSYFEEQEEIRKSLKKAIGDFDEQDDGNDDSLLVVKEKTEKEERQEENDYLAWLKGEKKELEDKEASKELAPLKAYWSNPNLTHKEKVLRDYILNNGYMDQEGRDEESSEDEDGEDVDLSEDEEFLDRADNYERTYNFRHEEPGGFEIKSYPRVIETSVRAKAENKRAERRKRLAEKKQREKEERMEEMKMLQKLQKEEKEEKLKKLQELSDDPQILKYLETDFDPEEHDRLMREHYDDGYYQEEGEEEKPEFEQDEEMNDGTFGDDTDDWWHQRAQAQEEENMAEGGEGGEEEELYADDPGFIMDADYDPNVAVSKKSKKEKKKSKKNKKDDKPLFDPTTKTFDEYLDEYLKDKINRLPFTYREVVPNDFGLATNEILAAEDKELNAWVSVKRMSQYRTKDSEMYDLKKYQRKAKNQYKLHQVIPSLAPQNRAQEPSDITRPKPPKKKNKDKQAVDASFETKKAILDDKSEGKKKDHKKKRLKSDVESDADSSMCLPGNSMEPKKKKIKIEKSLNGGVEGSETVNLVGNDDESGVLKKKKKKKKKERMDQREDIDKREHEKSFTSSSPKLKKKEKEMNENDRLSSKTPQDGPPIDFSPMKIKKSKKRKQEEVDDSVLDISHAETSKKKIRLEEIQSAKFGDKVKKLKKLKKMRNYDTKVGHANVEFKNKKHRKNFSDLRVDVTDSKDKRPSGADKKEANRNLRMVMSKSRLSSYGLKKAKKNKKSDKEQMQD